MSGLASPAAEETLAIFGAPPTFETPIATGQLANRDPEQFFALARGVFERRWLTNHGPLVARLEDELAGLHGAAHCISFANACFALVLAIRALARPNAHEVVLPAFTFRGLPHLIRWAGLTPVYADVDPVSHALTPQTLAPHLSRDTAAVLAVDNAHALCDAPSLEMATATHGVPLILDSVYGVRGVYADGAPVGSRGACAVFSLHATKLINGFEGGYLTTNNDALAAALRRQRTFGFGGEGVPQELGLNAKLNELHAAMALSNLPHLDAIVAGNRRRFDAYQRRFAHIDWARFAAYAPQPGVHSLVLLEVSDDAPVTRDELVSILRAENALVRPYYSPPLHQTDPRGAAASLPVTEALAKRFIQMPVGDGIDEGHIDRLGEIFERLEWIPGLATRLRGAA